MDRRASVAGSRSRLHSSSHSSGRRKPMKLACMRPLADRKAARRACRMSSEEKSWVSWLCKNTPPSSPAPPITPTSDTPPRPFKRSVMAQLCCPLRFKQAARVVRRLLALMCFVLLASGGLAYWWLHQPLWTGAQALELAIEPGAPARPAAAAGGGGGVLCVWFCLWGQGRAIKAGNYEIPPGTTPIALLQKLVRGEEALRTLTLVEGWNWRQLRQALARQEQLRPDSAALDDGALMAQIGRPGVAPEGRFFPDTYTYAKGSSDLALLRRALHAMDRQLQAAWAMRAADTPLQSAEQALILASIVEKETGRASDRSQIAGVFANRLRAGMLLQTDPTVIYGLGEKFDGNLRRRDLQADTPWNTYTRAGLPPTPIAMPGKAALLAAVRPEATRALYFVAKGDGGSHFSASLQEHNRAVNRYQRGP